MAARIAQQNKKGRGIQAIASDKKEAKRTIASVLRRGEGKSLSTSLIQLLETILVLSRFELALFWNA
jgi:hypothetical protein